VQIKTPRIYSHAEKPRRSDAVQYVRLRSASIVPVRHQIFILRRAPAACVLLSALPGNQSGLHVAKLSRSCRATSEAVRQREKEERTACSACVARLLLTLACPVDAAGHPAAKPADVRNPTSSVDGVPTREELLPHTKF